MADYLQSLKVNCDWAIIVSKYMSNTTKGTAHAKVTQRNYQIIETIEL